MRKYKLISALAEETAKEVVRNEESWRRYLNTASRLYKYPFKETTFNLCPKTGCNRLCFHRDME